MNKPMNFLDFFTACNSSYQPFNVSSTERRKRNPYPLKEIVAGGICVGLLYCLFFFAAPPRKEWVQVNFPALLLPLRKSRVRAPTKVTPSRMPRATQAKIVGTTNVDHCSPAFTFERSQFQSKKDPLFKTG